MADAPIGGIFAMFGGLLSAGAQIEESQDRAYALESEAMAADENARLARLGGAYNAARQSMQSQKIIGGIETDIAASGVASDSVSALEVLRESHRNAELDRQNVVYGAELSAYNYTSRARAARAGAAATTKAGRMNAFNSAFGAGARSLDYFGNSPKQTTTGSPPSQSAEFRGGNLRADSYYGY